MASYVHAWSKWARIKDDAYVSSSSPDGATGAKLLSTIAGLLINWILSITAYYCYVRSCFFHTTRH